MMADEDAANAPGVVAQQHGAESATTDGTGNHPQVVHEHHIVHDHGVVGVGGVEVAGQGTVAHTGAVRELSLVTFLHVTAFGMVLPGLSELTLRIFDDDSSKAGFALGVFSAGITVLQFFSNAFYGILSDHWGRRPFLLVTVAGFAVGALVVAILANLTGMILAALVIGLTSCLTAIVSAGVIDISDSVDEYTRHFGRVGSAAAIGLVVGVGIGSGISSSGYVRLPFLAAAAWEVLSLSYVSLGYRETIDPDGVLLLSSGVAMTKRQLLAHSTNPLATMRIFGTTRRLTFFAVATFFQAAAASVVSVFLVFGRDRYGWSASDIGAFLLYGSLTIVFALLVVLPRLHRWLGDDRMLVSTGAVLMVALFLYAFSTKGWMAYVIATVTCPAFILPATLSSEMSKEISEENQGRLNGADSSLRTVAATIGSLGAAGLYSYFASDSAPIYFPGAAFFMAGIWMMVSLVFLFVSVRYPSARKSQRASTEIVSVEAELAVVGAVSPPASEAAPPASSDSEAPRPASEATLAPAAPLPSSSSSG